MSAKSLMDMRIAVFSGTESREFCRVFFFLYATRQNSCNSTKCRNSRRRLQPPSGPGLKPRLQAEACSTKSAFKGEGVLYMDPALPLPAILNHFGLRSERATRI